MPVKNMIPTGKAEAEQRAIESIELQIGSSAAIQSIPEDTQFDDEADLELGSRSQNDDSHDAQQNASALPFDPKTKEESTSTIVGWDGPSDPENPVNWPSWLRWTHIMLVSLIAFISGCASSIFAPGIGALMSQFHSSSELLGSLVVTIFVLGLATGPVICAPLSETYGRTPVQYAGNIGFLVFTIACAVSSDFQMFIVFRLFQGIFASVPLTQGGAIIADMVRQEERGLALSIFLMGPILGPSISPVPGGFLASSEGWRWTFWVLAIAVCPT
jgi:multidrug resistance protein